jgi:putative intracellular protease/amidase/YHS domain-containing protein
MSENSAKSGAAEEGESRLALTGLDPVMLVQGKQVEGFEKLSATRKGLQYRFTNAANKAAFDKAPEKYEAQFDGHCAVSPTLKGTPSIFAVHKGKIYLFYCTFCRGEFLKNPEKYAKPPKTVAILLYEGVELLDVAGPGEVFSGAGHPFKVITVAADAKLITSQDFLEIKPNHSFADCPKVDFLVVPGGNTLKAIKDPRVIKWVRKASADAEVTLSVCTGAFILAEAGVLDGKKATTHWGAVEELKTKYPKVTVCPDKRFVDNGKVVTAAGVAAGIDGALHVVEKVLGKDRADKVSKAMEYRRDGRK